MLKKLLCLSLILHALHLIHPAFRPPTARASGLLCPYPGESAPPKSDRAHGTLKSHKGHLWIKTPAGSHAPPDRTTARNTSGTVSQEGRREKRRGARPLWPGTRFTDLDRARAIRRGMRFIYRTARQKRNFAEYGSDYLWCFYTLGATVRDADFRRLTRRMGVERARRWRRDHRALPPYADADTVADFAFGSDAADGLGVRDDRLKEQIRRAAARFPARAFLRFDPLTEPPPGDVPEGCGRCRANNPRGSKTCSACRGPLAMRSRYDVWCDALITAYSGERYGVKLGARYVDVLKWLPTMRPYRGRENGANPDFYDTVYAVTHVIYTLNDYGTYRLSPRWLPQEFAFLKANLREALALKDADMLGEFMDSLRSFGLTDDDPRMRAGTEYLLSNQNADGSWGGVNERDIYLRYHPTWNAVAALSDYAWRGEGLSFPELKPLLEQWAHGRQAAGQGIARRGRSYWPVELPEEECVPVIAGFNSCPVKTSDAAGAQRTRR